MLRVGRSLAEVFRTIEPGPIKYLLVIEGRSARFYYKDEDRWEEEDEVLVYRIQRRGSLTVNKRCHRCNDDRWLVEK